MNEFQQTYQKIYQTVKPLNYILDGFIVVILAVSFLILVPLLIAAFRLKWSTMKIDMKVAIAMVIFDFLSALDSFNNHLINLFNTPWNFNSQLACTITSIFSVLVFFNSVILVGVLSIERCLLVVYKKKYSDSFYYTIIFIAVFMNVAICLFSVLTNGLSLIPVGTYCLFDVTTIGGMVGSLLAGGLVGTCLFATFFGYIKICLFRKEQSKKELLELGLDPAKVQKEVNSTVLKSLSIVFVSALANGPYTLILFLQIASPTFNTPELYVVATILINLNITLNSLLLINMKPELCKDIKRMYGFKVDP